MTCKYCHQSSLHWVETKVGWRLFNYKNIQHNCRSKKPLVAPKSNFKINFKNDPKINRALAIFKRQLRFRA